MPFYTISKPVLYLDDIPKVGGFISLQEWPID